MGRSAENAWPQAFQGECRAVMELRTPWRRRPGIGLFAAGWEVIMVEDLTAFSQFLRTEDNSPAAQFLQTVVRPAIYAQRIPLAVTAHHLHGEPIPVKEALLRSFMEFEVGQTWGGMWDTSWFRFRGAIPEAWGGSEVVALIHLGGDEVVGFTAEGQIWDTHGHIVHGLHHEHREYRVASRGHG